MIMLMTVLSAHAGPPALPPGAEEVGRGMWVHVERAVDAPPEQVWQRLAHEFTAIADWSDGVSESRELGVAEVPEGYPVDADAPLAGRWVTTETGTARQVLVDFDTEALTYTFRGADLPRVLAYAANVHRVTALPDGMSQVSVDVYLVPKGIATLFRGKIQRKFTEYMDAYLEEAGRFAEATDAQG